MPLKTRNSVSPATMTTFPSLYQNSSSLLSFVPPAPSRTVGKTSRVSFSGSVSCSLRSGDATCGATSVRVSALARFRVDRPDIRAEYDQRQNRQQVKSGNVRPVEENMGELIPGRSAVGRIVLQTSKSSRHEAQAKRWGVVSQWLFEAQ